jgi:rhamnulokinase
MNDTADFLAVDIGASSGRVLLGRLAGDRIALSELHRFENNPVQVHGTLHWDVLRLWSEVQQGIARYADNARGAPAGIGVDTWGVDFALLDRAGRLLANPVCYRDARTNGMVEAATQQVSRARIFERTGIQFMQINTLYQLYSMARAADPLLGAAGTLLLMPDLLHYWMTGRAVVEATNASTTQMLDCFTREWARDLLDALAIPHHFLPDIVPPGTILGPLRPDVAAHVGLASDVPVIATGTHDTANAVAAVPDLDEQSAYISSGTWSLIGVEAPQPVVSARALALNVTNEGGVAGTTRLLKNVMGLWLLQESRRQWQREGHTYSWEEILSLAEREPPFASLIDPDAAEFLAPGDMPAAVRAFCARTGQIQPASVGAVARCCLESLALKYRAVLEGIEELVGRRLDVIRVVGGGSQNRLLNQFTADACGRPVVAGPVEATALGNIVVQAIAAGILPDRAAGRQAVKRSGGMVEYEPRAAAAWEEVYPRFTALLGR